MSLPRNSAERKHQKSIAVRKKPKMEEMEVGGREEEGKTIAPIWWEVAMFRILNAIMVIFFLSAVVKLRTDDNACLWIPTFLVPAFLSTIVAVKPQLSGIIYHILEYNTLYYPPQSVCGGRRG